MGLGSLPIPNSRLLAVPLVGDGAHDPYTPSNQRFWIGHVTVRKVYLPWSFTLCLADGLLGSSSGL
jgi:hypothetical protein